MRSSEDQADSLEQLLSVLLEQPGRRLERLNVLSELTFQRCEQSLQKAKSYQSVQAHLEQGSQFESRLCS